MPIFQEIFYKTKSLNRNVTNNVFLNSLYYFLSNYFDSLPGGCFIDVLVICCNTSVKEWLH